MGKTKRRPPRTVPTFTMPKMTGKPPACQSCLRRAGELRQMIRRGEGTPAELRQAIAWLEQNPPPGTTVWTKAKSTGNPVPYCPRCTDDRHLVKDGRGRVTALNV